jgi:hypothetical protein
MRRLNQPESLSYNGTNPLEVFYLPTPPGSTEHDYGERILVEDRKFPKSPVLLPLRAQSASKFFEQVRQSSTLLELYAGRF